MRMKIFHFHPFALASRSLSSVELRSYGFARADGARFTAMSLTDAQVRAPLSPMYSRLRMVLISPHAKCKVSFFGAERFPDRQRDDRCN